jgi:hypothetical protein
MDKKYLLIGAVVALVLALAVGGVVMAQTATPQASPSGHGMAMPFMGGMGPFGFMGGRVQGTTNWSGFDAEAGALKMTPDQLFDALHSGKSLSAIATAQGVQLSAVQQAAQAAAKQQFTNAINQAVSSGRITQDRANWMLQGLQNGWLGGGGFFGAGRFGGMGRGMGPNRHFQGRNAQPASPSPTPTSPTA